MIHNDHDIKTLNSLIETTLDSSDGYAEAAKDAKSAPLVSLFTARATERRETASTLQRCVRARWAVNPRMTAPCSLPPTACS